MTTQELICTKCGICTTEPLLTPSGSHLKASCPECGAYIKFVTQGGARKLYFGKHNGKEIREVAEKDPDYLRRLIAQPWCKPTLRTAIQEAMR